MKKYSLFLIIIFVAVFILTGCSGFNKSTTNKEYIKLFYPDANVEYWLIEEKELAVDPSVVVNELIKNKNNLIPTETELIDIKIENNIAYVNLSKSFENLSLGDTGIWINIYTIVNTLTLNENLNIDYVQLLIDGEIRQFIGDTITVKPIAPNIELMKLY